MFKKNYYFCTERIGRNNCYICKKFENFYIADSHSIIFDNSYTIEVYDNLPEFLVPIYLKYKIIKSKITYNVTIKKD